MNKGMKKTGAMDMARDKMGMGSTGYKKGGMVKAKAATKGYTKKPAKGK
jgi:hypothetical protein